jgi:hypothetical protein
MRRDEPSTGVRRVVLVPKAADGRSGTPAVRRYGLGRIAGSPQSSLGTDRHERLERVAERGGNS